MRATAASVTVAGKVQTPPGPDIKAIGSGLMVILVVVLFVHPAALVTLKFTLYVPGNEYVTKGDCKLDDAGDPPVKDHV